MLSAIDSGKSQCVCDDVWEWELVDSILWMVHTDADGGALPVGGPLPLLHLSSSVRIITGWWPSEKVSGEDDHKCMRVWFAVVEVEKASSNENVTE